MKVKELTAERLRELLTYNPETGAFYWRQQNSPRIAVGMPAGGVDYSRGHGYLRIQIDRRLYNAHRLAWLYVHGKWPNGMIDHINRISTDNRLCNLRPATHRENMQNRIAPMHHNKCGLLGVCLDCGQYRADIRINNRKVYLGAFATPAEAHAAYMRAKRQHHVSQPVVTQKDGF